MTASPFDPFVAEPWMTEALCAQIGGDLWFPDQGGPVQAAKNICATCPVRAECLEFALAAVENPVGVWGGTSPNERRRLRQERNTA